MVEVLVGPEKLIVRIVLIGIEGLRLLVFSAPEIVANDPVRIALIGIEGLRRGGQIETADALVVLESELP